MDRGRLIELALAKLNDGKDITWEEITELCGWDVNPDHCRKVAYGIKLSGVIFKVLIFMKIKEKFLMKMGTNILAK